MYCDPYVDAEDGFVAVDENDVAVGYVFSVLTVEKYLKIMEKYVPLIKELGNEYASRIDQTLHMYDNFSEKYPSHLHIDILEEYTGQHIGTDLMHALFSYLREKGCCGVMLGVSASNQRGTGFYRHCGFEVLFDFGSAVIMGKSLAQDLPHLSESEQKNGL